mmetsp:Transcript_6015/g.23837  ORF Transcript_6015/g.23837 Transcript_6015/m.23837 type:complete len:86 (-) Transcript_6015:135-392(-)
MAKSTNHTAHNQSYKNHRNGIKKPKRVGKPSTKGVRIALLRRSHITVRNALASTRPAQPIADHLRLFRLADGSEVPQEPKVRQER